jgi:hypothetical protein
VWLHGLSPTALSQPIMGFAAALAGASAVNPHGCFGDGVAFS